MKKVIGILLTVFISVGSVMQNVWAAQNDNEEYKQEEHEENIAMVEQQYAEERAAGN